MHKTIGGVRSLEPGYARVLEAAVPEGVAADVVLPDGARPGVAGGTHRFAAAFGAVTT